jgi:eukaryotic-like serine/threonine-protein kinase
VNQPRPEPSLNCVSCGAPNVLVARFCNQCGLSLGESFNATTLTISSPPVSMPMSHRSLGVASTRPPPALSGVGSTRPAPPALQERATDQRELADPLIGVVVAERYRIKEPIGRGGMGVVYRVEHARIGKHMALKLLTGELTRDPRQVARFKREAQLVSKLSHPNTVQVFDFGASDGLVYLAMEYLKGEDLGHLIRRLGPLGVERTLKIVIQICSSLGEAHGKGMVHRDLKPENIIVTQGGDPDEDLIKVLDFGLAKLREGGELSEVTSRGAIVGTPYYMSPEQIRGDDVGPESDVYSLGALIYACLTGTVVFDASTPMGVLTKHLTELPESPSRRFPDLRIPSSVSQVVMSALEKDPKLRLSSVAELQQALIIELEHGGKQRDVERLLDFSHLRHAGDGDDGAITRDEVERYERKLRQRSRALWVVSGLLLALVAAFGFRTYERWTAAPTFAGSELEPNDAASEATRVPFPFAARGIIGKRLDKERSDRDFYRFSVPPGGTPTALEVSEVSGLAWCALLYRAGSEEPLGRYCPGSPDKRLSIGALRLSSGDYVLGLMQDREAYTKDPPPTTIEHISESYRLSVGPADAAAVEIEPNDFPRDASLVAVGEKTRGRLAWMRDRDVLCATGQAKVRLRVTDAPEHPRSRAAVLQVTPLAGADLEIPVRVHRPGARDVQESPRDAIGPWLSTAMDPAAGRPACVQLALVPNPWAPTPHPLLAPAGEEPYIVEALEAP